MTIHWKSHLWRNTVTNYLRTVIRMATGLIMFRLLFQYLSEEQFGYWSLLWSVIGFTVLLDFGLGLTAQREVARCNATGDWSSLNRLVSTMVWSFAILGGVILLASIAGRSVFLQWIHVSPENLKSFSNVYWIFFVSLAFGFPLGIFPEMLAGLQRQDLANWTRVVATLLNLVLVCAGVWLRWSIEVLMLIGIVTTLGPTLVNYFMVRRLMPQLSLSVRHFDLPSVKPLMSFSMVAYFITLTNIVVTRTDQIVISACIGVAFVTIYQAGFKISDTFAIFTRQMQVALSPAAAHLKATKDHEALNELLVKSTRLVFLLATPAYIVGAWYLDPVIRLVTGLAHVSAEIHWVGELLLLTTYSQLVTNSCSKKILVMSGWEKPLLRLSATEAVLNLLLSVLLVFKLGVVGVALGTFVPGVTIGWMGINRLTLQVTGIGFWDWSKRIYLAVMAPIASSVGVLILLTLVWPATGQDAIWTYLIRGALVMVPPCLFLFKRRRELL